MFPLTPYIAEYSVFVKQGDGKSKREWRSCKVLGVTMVDEAPNYLIEIYRSGTSSLTTVDEVRRNERGNPL
ncbi:hypothetical protein [Rhizobium sp. Rhizsp82]|uniref:hypothetical protein n=1 Tax=Rhizobium sp. Rhizsp82 TaxID=3243057 RepID=UPI0039B381C9